MNEPAGSSRPGSRPEAVVLASAAVLPAVIFRSPEVTGA